MTDDRPNALTMEELVLLASVTPEALSHMPTCELEAFAYALLKRINAIDQELTK